MKRITKLEHSKIANNLMYYIYKNIDSQINIDELAKDFGISKFHLHRIFKEQIGSNIYESIKSIRLQKAANLLITNSGSTITQISNMCGYSSQTSFIRAFKKRFLMTPKTWRRGGYKNYSNKNIGALTNIDKFNKIEVDIVKKDTQKAYYIRHRGYSKDIKSIWQKMRAWVYSNSLNKYKELGIYHDNPIITPLDECYYIAAVVVDSKINLDNSNLPYFYIPDGLYATFKVDGEYGDILELIQWVYHYWLPKSGYEATTNPSYTHFYKNHFLSRDNSFSVTYYLPIRYEGYN